MDSPGNSRGHLHHVELYVSNLERSLEFWEWFLLHLGYVEYQRWEEGASYLLGDTYIVFVQAESRYLEPPYHRCRPGLNHLAFHAASPDDVDEMKRHLDARNVPLLYDERYPHAGGPEYYALFFEDPDRIKVEFVAP